MTEKGRIEKSDRIARTVECLPMGFEFSELPVWDASGLWLVRIPISWAALVTMWDSPWDPFGVWA